APARATAAPSPRRRSAHTALPRTRRTRALLVLGSIADRKDAPLSVATRCEPPRTVPAASAASLAAPSPFPQCTHDGCESLNLYCECESRLSPRTARPRLREIPPLEHRPF